MVTWGTLYKLVCKCSLYQCDCVAKRSLIRQSNTSIRRETHRGVFAPALTNAGLPLVDGAAAFSWVHLVPGTKPHPMQNLGEYLRCAGWNGCIN